MGNLLCVPKSPKGKGTQRVSKKKSLKKRLFQRNKVENLAEKEDNKSDTQKSSGINNLKVIEASNAYHKDTSTTDGKTETQQPKYHIDPVVSSSILLRTFDEEREDNTERTRTSGESGDVPRIGEDSILSTEHQQQPENITDDEKELEELDDVTSIAEVNVSATKEPLLDSDSGSNKGLDDQPEKSDDVTVASNPSLSVTDESHFKERPENETDGEQSEKPDGFEKTNMPVTLEPLFQEKPNKIDGEQHSKEYHDDFSAKKGHISNTDQSLKKDYNQTDKPSLTGTHSCPAITKQPKQSAHLIELTKMLAALPDIKVPPRSDKKQSTSFSRNLPSPQPTTSGLFSESGHYKSEEGIQKWLQNSTSCTMESVMTEDNQTVDQQKKNVNDFEVPNRKVSDFEVPRKAPRKPPTPLVLKKPSPHLYNLPSIVKTDLEENGTVKWVQREPTGSQTEVLWASRPTSYNVKFPSLPKRLLEREGSIDKMRDDCVLPQTKQIEILKREYGRFPGLKVPQTLRGKYSFDVQEDTAAEKVDIKKEDNGGDEHGNTNNDDNDTRKADKNDDDSNDGEKIMKNLR